MLTKKEQRLRRARQTRIRIAQQGVARLSVNRTNLHIYASVVSEDGTKVLASAPPPKPKCAPNWAPSQGWQRGCRYADWQAHCREGEGCRRGESGFRSRWFRIPRPREGFGRSRS